MLLKVLETGGREKVFTVPVEQEHEHEGTAEAMVVTLPYLLTYVRS
jgi:hypothetical protein